VVTNQDTRFRHGRCRDLDNGTRVEVRGTRQSNGSVLAVEVEFGDDDDDDDDGEEMPGVVVLGNRGDACEQRCAVARHAS
jgi:hypothetical protein